MADVFISCSSQDHETALTLRSHIESGGYTCWMAPDDVKGPETWAEQILRAIQDCRVVVVLVSEEANRSGHVANEVTIAFDKRKAILPVRVEDVQPAGSLEYLLKLQQWVDAFPGPIDRHYDVLQDKMQALMGAVTESATAQPVRRKRGLRAILRRRTPAVLAAIGLLLLSLLVLGVYGVYAVIKQATSGLPASATVTGVAVDVGDIPEVKLGGQLNENAGPGQIRWSHSTMATVWSAPLVTKDTVYVGNASGAALAVGTSTGKLEWKTDVGAELPDTPLLVGKTLLFGAQDRRLYALDAETGEGRWTVKVDLTDEQQSWPVVSRPVPVPGGVCFGAADGKLRAVSSEDGRRLWEVQAVGNQMTPNPSYADGMVLFSGYDLLAGAVDADSGRIAWSFQMNGAYAGYPVSENGAAYFRSDAGKLYCVDVKTGASRWSKEIDNWTGENTPSVGSPAVGSGIVVYPGRSGLHAVDAATGDDRWEFKTKGEVFPAAIDGGLVCFGSRDGNVYAVDAKTGREVWTCRVSEKPSSPTVLREGVAYVGGEAGTLYAIQAAP